MLPSAVTEHADVVLPVAAAPEKAGAYLDWEGRLRPFDATLHGTGQLPDGRVLQGLADELDVDLRLPAPEVARAELAALGVVAERPRVADWTSPRRTTPTSPRTRRCSRPGGTCSTSGPCSATSPSWPAPPARGGPSRQGHRPPAGPGRRRPGHRLRRDGGPQPAGAGHRDARPGGLAADALTGSEVRPGLGTPPGGLVRLSGVRTGATASGVRS
jgi:NADH-quinone oxidoreductase subunit G